MPSTPPPIGAAFSAMVATLLTASAMLILTVDASAQATSTSAASHIPAFVGPITGLFPDASGVFRNATNNPAVVNRSNAFFDPGLGMNGQACVTCHQPNQGFSVIVPAIRQQFERTNGLDPLFRFNDTATNPRADLSTEAKRRHAFQLALDLGLFRIGKTFPAAAEFTVATQTTDRFGVLPNSADPQAPGVPTLSLFRRPLATTNTRFDSVVLWDGRQNIHNLRNQVKAAARTLMLGNNVTDAQADSVASLMTSVFTAQDVNRDAGLLTLLGAHGGADNLRALATSPSAPCVPMADPNQPPFVPAVTPPSSGQCSDPTRPFDLYAAWQNVPVQRLRSVARGEQLFNTRQFTFPGIPGTFPCTACHTTTNIGNFPFVDPNNAAPNASLFVRYGLDSPEFLTRLAARDHRLDSFVQRTSALPVYSISLSVAPEDVGPKCGPAILPDLTTGQPIFETLNQSTDPGRAMVTGLCADLGGFKPPILRGLASHAPYFHNGAAATIEDIVNFYDVILSANFTSQDRADLAAYLRSL